MKISQTVLELQSRHDFVTDRQTDGQTTRAKTRCLPTLRGGGDIINVYSPEQGQTTLRGQNFDVNRKFLSLRSFVTSFKKISLKSDFIHIFLMILYMYIAPGQGQTTPWGQNFDVNRKALSLCPFVASFNNISLKSDFIHIIHVYSPRTGANNPLGTKF